MKTTTELQYRIEAKRKELEAQIAKAKADTGHEAREAVKQTRKRLDELKGLLADGWDNMTESAAEKLNQWLRED